MFSRTKFGLLATLCFSKQDVPVKRGAPERVNDFSAPGVMNLLRRVLSISGRRSPMVVG